MMELQIKQAKASGDEQKVAFLESQKEQLNSAGGSNMFA
jgi:hypothetical protein